jgi:Tol biopolymer transport system component
MGASAAMPLLATPTTTAGATTLRISLGPAGAQGDKISEMPRVSADGAVVAFFSTATTLVPGDTNGVKDVFVWERSTETVSRVSLAQDGGQADAQSLRPDVSADGRYVVFESQATNILPDRGFANQVYRYDRQTHAAIRASVNADGVAGNSFATNARVSGDGNVIAFLSLASNLVTNDTNGQLDVFVHDAITHVTERVSVRTDGTQSTCTNSSPSLSFDGRYVAFSNVCAFTGPGFDVGMYVRDRVLGTTTRIDGTQGQGEIAADGRSLVYRTSQLWSRDLATGSDTLVSINIDGLPSNGASALPALSPDGRFVAFWSTSPDLVPGDFNGGGDIFLRDLRLGTTVRVSVSDNGLEVAGDPSNWAPSVSADGSLIAFDSLAPTLVPSDTNGVRDVFLRRLPGGNTAPTVSLPADKKVLPGADIDVFGRVGDPDVGDSWTGDADFGDGTGLVALSIEADAAFVLQHVYPTIGDRLVHVRVFDRAGASGSADLVVHVINDPPRVEFLPGALTVDMPDDWSGFGRITDDGPIGSWNVTVDYGDGTPVDAFASPNRDFVLRHWFRAEGEYTVRVEVVDGLGGVGSRSVQISVRPRPSLIFVHGITGSYRDHEQFGPLLSGLKTRYPVQDRAHQPALDQVHYFQYFRDTGDAVGSAQECDRDAARLTFAPPVRTGGMPISLDHASLSGPCYSQSDVAINAVFLDQDVRALHERFGGPVTIVANSMGGAITRAYLAYVSSMDEGTQLFPDTVVMLQGAEAGSYALVLRTAVLSTQDRYLYELTSSISRELFKYDPDSPAIEDLTPGSELLQWVNPSPAHVPADVRYLNVASDIHLLIHANVLGIPVVAAPTVGDYALLPGDSDPTALPLLGGARFDPGVIGRGRSDSEEWILERTIPIEWGAFVPFIETGDIEKLPTPVRDLLRVPEWHGALGSQMHLIVVDDPDGGRGPLDEVLIRLITRVTP